VIKKKTGQGERSCRRIVVRRGNGSWWGEKRDSEKRCVKRVRLESFTLGLQRRGKKKALSWHKVIKSKWKKPLRGKRKTRS